jgi:tRNA A37 methylthiotransferase MiaB
MYYNSKGENDPKRFVNTKSVFVFIFSSKTKSKTITLETETTSVIQKHRKRKFNTKKHTSYGRNRKYTGRKRNIYPR